MATALALGRAPAPTPDPPAELLRLDGVTKSWPAHPRPVLAGVDLALTSGSVTSIAGSNGVGKTTLLRIVAGVIAPDAGQVRLEALDPERCRRAYQSKIGYLSAGDHGLYARLTVREQIELWIRLALMPRARRGQAVSEALGLFGLADLADQRVERLSLGQRQRVRLALAFAHRPRVVLLDEPLNSLDAQGALVVADAIARLRHAGGACIWASPEPPEVGIDFHARLWLADGRLERA